MLAGITEVPNEAPEYLNVEVGTPGYCLLLPGRKLNLTALLYAKKFRNHGYKTGALAAFGDLEAAGLGTLEISRTKTGKVKIKIKVYILIIDHW